MANLKLEAIHNNGNDNVITYKGIFAGRIDVRVDVFTDGSFDVDVFANGSKVGTLVAYEIADRQNTEDVTFSDVIDEFLQLANVGR